MYNATHRPVAETITLSKKLNKINCFQIWFRVVETLTHTHISSSSSSCETLLVQHRSGAALAIGSEALLPKAIPEATS